MVIVFVCALLVASAIWPVAVVVRARQASGDLIADARRRVPLVLTVDRLSAWQQQALLRVEDPSFYQHHGIDLHTPGQGLTTITQSLVKWIYFERFVPGVFNKLRQSLIARYVLDGALSKSAQIDLYVNMVYLGQSNGRAVRGFAEAARAYYGKPFEQLDETEYLSIIAMINSPEGFHVQRRAAANTERVRRIRKLLSGEYQPNGLRDMYYGPLDAETQSYLAPVSYQPSLYEGCP